MEQSLFLEGLVFSTVAIGGIGLVAWWLFFSPLSASIGSAQAISPSVARIFGVLISLGVPLFAIGGYWDASEHVVTGIIPGGDDFLWPPHLMIYGGFLLSFGAALGGLIVLARLNLAAGVRDPRLWVRRNPYLGATVLVAGYGLFSVPGDAIWHEIYGIDLTAWSPPHVFLFLATASTAICAIGLLLRSRQTTAPEGVFALFLMLMMAMILNLAYLIGVLEWELGTVAGFILDRPSWLYPVITGSAAFFILVLGRRLIAGPWTATTIALIFFAWRIGTSAFAEAISGAPPRLTLVFLLGAVLLDLAAQRSHRQGIQQALIEAGAFTAGFVVVALPTIQFVYLPYLTRFTALDHITASVVTFAVCLALQPVAQKVGEWLAGDRMEEEPVRSLSPAMGD